MDLTQLFKASVKTVRLRNKISQDRNRSKIKTRDDFLFKAIDVRYQVTQLRDLLFENRASYMRFGFHLKTSSQMSDEERDIIDIESEKIITICSQYIDDLKANIIASDIHTNKQIIQHKIAVLDILNDYLQSVFRIHNQQKKNRIQHQIDTLKLLKLESNSETIPEAKNGLKINIDESSKFKEIASSEGKDESSLNPKRMSIAIDEDQASKLALEDESLCTDDFQMLETENMQLLNDLKGLTDEVELIEKNVAGIAKLQEMFTEKVTAQKHDIERIGNVVVGATENIRDANEQIKQAIQRNAGLRVWVLFFLIVMSFTLLFLDWYNE